MKFIYRSHIDTARWDALVASNSDSDVFSLSTYLDAVAENWCVLVNDNYSAGIALPFTIRLGIKSCYTPIFVRALRWMGDREMEEKVIIQLIQNEFRKGQLALHGFTSNHSEKAFVFQSLGFPFNRKIGERGKRMLKKCDAAKFKIQGVPDSDAILDHIAQELPRKNKGNKHKFSKSTKEFDQEFCIDK